MEEGRGCNGRPAYLPPLGFPSQILTSHTHPLPLAGSHKLLLLLNPHHLSQLTFILRRTEGVLEIDEEEQDQLCLR